MLKGGGGHEYAGNINIKIIQKKIFETFLIQWKKHNSQSNNIWRHIDVILTSNWTKHDINLVNIITLNWH